MSNGKHNDSRIPKWFSLGKYEKAASASFLEWAINLQLRDDLLYASSDAEAWNNRWSGGARKEGWALLNEAGFIAIEHFSDDIECQKELILRNMKIDGGHGKGLVFSLPLIGAYDIYQFILGYSELRQKLAVIDYQDILSPFRLEPLSKPEERLRDWHRGEFENDSLDHFDEDSLVARVCVDLDAPDEMIIAAFRDWLAGNRKENVGVDQAFSSGIPHKKFSERLVAKWYKASILPYLDLKIHEQLSGEKIPLHVIGTAIFPNTVDIDTTESVRKTTKPLAHAALRQHYYLLRQAIIEELHNKAE